MEKKLYPITVGRKKKARGAKSKTFALIAIILICSSILASAALLQYFARIVMVVDVPPAIEVDGAEYGTPITDEIPDEFPSGKYCFFHWIDNYAEVPVNLRLEKNFVSGDDQDINVTYYDYKNYETRCFTGLNGSAQETMNFTKSYGQYFGWEPLILYEKNVIGCKTKFCIKMPRNIVFYDDNFDQFTLIIDDNSSKRMMVGFNNPEKWQYRENGFNYTSIPSWIEVNGDDNQKWFNITIQNDKLGNNNSVNDDCGLSYKYVLLLELSTLGYPGFNAITIGEPINPILMERTLGIKTPFINISANEKGHIFSICYDFEHMIMGHYEIWTDVLLNN